MKGRKFIAAASAIMVGVAAFSVCIPTVFADEKADTGMNIVREHQENGEKEMKAKAPRAKVIYVKTIFGGNPNGDGTQGNPYDDFKTAYANAAPGDTIKLLNAVTIQSDSNNSDTGVFVFDKAVTIIGEGAEAPALTPRVPIQLSSDIILENLDFSCKGIYLNGHSLTMNNVKNFKTTNIKPVVYGGAFNNQTAGQGNKSVLTVSGSVGDPFVFDTIYAGDDNGTFDKDVEINLNTGSKVTNVVSADGVNGGVTGTVTINAGNTSVKNFINENKDGKAILNANGYTGVDKTVIRGFDNVSLSGGTNIKIDGDDDFADIGHLEMNNAKLDLSKRTTPQELDSFKGSGDSIITVAQDGKIDIAGELSGTVELRTPGMDVSTSGPVIKDHVYVEALDKSTGTVTFKPYFTQPELMLKKETNNGEHQWVIRDNAVKNTPPTINAQDVQIVEGDKFDPLQGVTAHDVEDGEIILTNANIIANDVNPDKAGEYHITYKVTDKNGVSTEKTITVTVKPKESQGGNTGNNGNGGNTDNSGNAGNNNTGGNNGSGGSVADGNSGTTNKTPQVTDKSKNAGTKKTAKDNKVKTGDMTNIGALGVLLASSAGISVILLKNRKKKFKNSEK